MRLREVMVELGVAVDATLDGRPDAASEILRALAAADVCVTIENLWSERDLSTPSWVLVTDANGQVLRIVDIAAAAVLVDHPFPPDAARSIESYNDAGRLRRRILVYPDGRSIVEFDDVLGPR